jgi:diguanylate cyclase (GGDEF)-like protein
MARYESQGAHRVFSTAEVTDEQLHAMWCACSEISSQPDPRQACRRLSERLSQIISAPTAIFRREVSPWKLVASSPAPDGNNALVPTPPLAELENLAPAPGDGYLPIGGHDNPYWTRVPLDDELPAQSVLLLPGDWRAGAAAQWLPRFARTASIALRLSAAQQGARRGERLAAVAYSFARKLSQINGNHVLHQFIVDAAAKITNARLGGLSVYHAKEGAIAVAATYGYPSEAVGHVRIVPGSGIIGGVFASKKPLLVRDTTRVPGLMPRSRRYQTASFMAVPIVAGDDALGVITLADRADGHPFNRNDLAAACVITALSSLALEREQLTRMRDELAHTAAIDPLTSMFNRRYLHTRLDAELERSRRSGLPVALLMLDVDTFKSINDQMGHQTGDAVLRKLSEIVRRSVRASDVCTRYGGDEFAIVVSENAVSAAQTAERIRHRVEAFRWDSLGLPTGLVVTVSVGVSIGEVGESADGLIGRADQNLYQAKARGRNGVYPPENMSGLHEL